MTPNDKNKTQFKLPTSAMNQRLKFKLTILLWSNIDLYFSKYNWFQIFFQHHYVTRSYKTLWNNFIQTSNVAIIFITVFIVPWLWIQSWFIKCKMQQTSAKQWNTWYWEVYFKCIINIKEYIVLICKNILLNTCYLLYVIFYLQ